jgi:hypothetical protein
MLISVPPDLGLARGVWVEGAADVPLQRRFAEFDCRDIGENGAKTAKGTLKLPERSIIA